MNFERFVAGRISGQDASGFSSLIVKIAITTITLSLVVMILSTSIIGGFKSQIASKVFGFWGHIDVTDGNVGNSFELIPMNADTALITELESVGSVSYARPPSIFKPDEVMPILTTSGGVKDIKTYVIVPGIVSDKEDVEGLLLKGIDSKSNHSELLNFLKSGDFIQFDSDQASRDILISAQTANRMQTEVGDKVIIHFILNEEPIKKAFTVSGIYKTGLEEYDRRFAIVDMRILQDVLEWEPNMVSGLEVYIDDIDDSEILSDYIWFEKLPGNLYSAPIKEKFSEIFQWLDLQNINERVIFILMMLVAIINMITAMLIFVLERTHMIGVLKAMGSSNWSIRRIFLINASTIIIKGLLIGNIIALTAGWIQQKTGVLKLREEAYYLDTVPVEFDFGNILLINIAAIVITILFLIIPSSIISKISPVKALRFE